MTSDELREAFLKFFEGKGHTRVPSSSLVPHGDPTLLLTNSGMVQMKPYFTGEAVPKNPRMASCQKSFRTTDIEAVGDLNHCTFFEMLGNFSAGDYFKKEAIAWAWEFVTEYLKLPPERLWITIFFDDETAFGLWNEMIGIPAERIKRFGEEDNFWGPAGDSGPCGPCSEIHYDFGEEYGCGKPDCGPNCECERFMELWNLVFTEYDQDREGHRTPLPKPNIDTGMGMERLSIIMQGKRNIYDTDIFTPLMQRVTELSGKEYGQDEGDDVAIRVVAEHSRAVAFLIADGVMPSNEGRGYVLRRLLRRAVLYGLRLGLDKPFLQETATVAIEKMKHIYPELSQRKKFILRVIELEEAGFSDTLNTGLGLLDKIIEQATSKKQAEISGKNAFRLYDTYGFPVELMQEVASQKGLSLDMTGFEQEMEGQRERARAAHRFENAAKSGLADKLDINETKFSGYTDLVRKSRVANLLVDDEPVDSIDEGQKAGIILEDTPFYGEMGGQIGDTGEIRTEKGVFQVTDTRRIQPGIIIHYGTVLTGSIGTGVEAEAEVDRERRLDIARNHTATHLLQAALKSVLGEYVQQRGSLVAADHFRFDFSHLEAMKPEEIEQVQNFVNDKIRRDLPVSDENMSYQEAVAGGAIALFDEKYSDFVRVLRVGRPPVSVELCGGTHVSTTGEIGFFLITSESSIGSGLRRIEAVTGRGAESYISRRLADLEQVAVLMEAETDEAVNKARNIVTELRTERRKVQELEKKLDQQKADSQDYKNVQRIGNPNLPVNIARVENATMDSLRTISDSLRDSLIKDYGEGIAIANSVLNNEHQYVVNVTPESESQGYDAGELAKKLTGGKGGGRSNLGQGKSKDVRNDDEIRQQVEEYIQEKKST